MADDSDIQFRGFGDLPEVDDTILEPVPENIPDELLVGDEQSRYEGFGPFHWYATVRTVCRSYKKRSHLGFLNLWPILWLVLDNT